MPEPPPQLRCAQPAVERCGGRRHMGADGAKRGDITMPATRIVRASPEATTEASAILAAGGLVAFPTETVYGLGADATNDAAVAKLYAAKERPSFNPLIVHVTDLAAAQRIAAFDARARALAR